MTQDKRSLALKKKKKQEEEEEEQVEEKEEVEEEGDGMKVSKNDEVDSDKLILKGKINDILSKLKANSKEERRRHLPDLTNNLMQYYGYNLDLIELFMTMFTDPTEMAEFFEANDVQRPITIRTNTLKTRRKELVQVLLERGVSLDSLADWTKVGLKIISDANMPVCETPEYLAGHYMM